MLLSHPKACAFGAGFAPASNPSRCPFGRIVPEAEASGDPDAGGLPHLPPARDKPYCHRQLNRPAALYLSSWRGGIP